MGFSTFFVKQDQINYKLILEQREERNQLTSLKEQL